MDDVIAALNFKELKKNVTISNSDSNSVVKGRTLKKCSHKSKFISKKNNKYKYYCQKGHWNQVVLNLKICVRQYLLCPNDDIGIVDIFDFDNDIVLSVSISSHIYV